MEERKKLLLKPVWDYKDIMKYFDVKQTFAYSIKERAIKECDGTVRIGNQYVKTNSVLALYGTSREEELEVIKSYEEYGDDTQIVQKKKKELYEGMLQD